MVLALAKYLPDNESHIYAEFFETYRYLLNKWEKQKQSYQDNAERHREASRQWRQNNKDRNSDYQRQYNQKKENKNLLNKNGGFDGTGFTMIDAKCLR